MNPDFLDLLCEFSAANVRFVVVGAYAVGVHGHPRATKDLDVWVDASPDNAPRVMQALQAFGAPLHGLVEADFNQPGVGVQIGVPPGRIDILTQISGVSFDEAWLGHIAAEFAPGIQAPVIGLPQLLQNKRASARLQDLADVQALEQLRPSKDSQP